MSKLQTTISDNTRAGIHKAVVRRADLGFMIVFMMVIVTKIAKISTSAQEAADYIYKSCPQRSARQTSFVDFCSSLSIEIGPSTPMTRVRINNSGKGKEKWILRNCPCVRQLHLNKERYHFLSLYHRNGI